MTINIIFTIVIAVLAFIDIKTTKTPNHKDFKAIIMTTGVLGTFVGVFIGLLDFNIDDIEKSIPFLLDGLKIAFYTSILGMSAAIAISVYQRFVGFKVDNKDNLDYITIQTKKLDLLDSLASMSEINREIKENLSQMCENLKAFSQDSKTTNNILIEKNAILAEQNIAQNAAINELLEHTKSHNQKLLAFLESSANNIVESSAKTSENLLNALKENIALLNENIDSNFLSLKNTQESLLNNASEKLNASFVNLINLNDRMLEISHKNLENNDKNTQSLIATLNALNADLVKQMQDLLFVIRKELEKLSSDFSADVICNMDNLAKSFSATIDSHFSENFKRFNKAIEGLLEWQDKHKQNMLDSNEILELSSASLKKLSLIVDNIINRDEKTIEVYRDVVLIMQEYKKENIELDKKLAAVRDLGDGALKALQFMDTFFNDLDNYVKSTNENLINSTKKTIKGVFGATIKEFEIANKKIVTDINSRDEAMLKHLSSASKHIENLNSTMLGNNSVLFQNYQKLNKDLELNVKAISQNTSEMISNINKEGIKHLKNTTKLYFDDITTTQQKILSNMSNQISKNQEMLDSTLLQLINKYLASLEAVNLNAIEAGKTLHLSNIESIKALNDEIAIYIKENAKSINKSNMELLNILEILQKEIEIMLDKTNETHSIAKDSINNIEESMKQVSDGFRGDYEWFLRRIREIIGQRL